MHGACAPALGPPPPTYRPARALLHAGGHVSEARDKGRCGGGQPRGTETGKRGENGGGGHRGNPRAALPSAPRPRALTLLILVELPLKLVEVRHAEAAA